MYKDYLARATFETNFIVMPSDCNYMMPMIFGGAFFSKMDLAAASCVSRILTLTDCDSAVTHKFSGTFHAAAQLGDIVYIYAHITEVRKKAIVVHIEAYAENRTSKVIERKHVASADFVFCSKRGGVFHPHDIPPEIFTATRDTFC